jgi:hypothetical protein
MLPSSGFASVIVIVSLAARFEKTAELATPAVIAVALIGYLLGRRRLLAIRPESLRRNAWPLGVAACVYGVCAAPMVLSGNATFLGYFVLNDGVFHLSLITQLLSHGHDLTRLPYSSYKAVLEGYIGSNYPTGADLPIGVGSRLTGQDIAWLFQPEQALYMVFSALAVYELLSSPISSRPLRVVATVVSALAAAVFSYYLEASVKEIASVWLITATIVLAFWVLSERPSWRPFIPIILTSAAGYYVFGAAIAPWIALAWVVLVLTTAFRLRRPVMAVPRRRLLTGMALIVAILAFPGYLFVNNALRFAHTAEAVLTQPGQLGNLLAPLSKWQLFGIWPADDFRLGLVTGYELGYILIGIALISIAFGTVWAFRRRFWAPLVLIVGDALTAVYLLHRADPYAAGKVMMIVSLASIMAAMLGTAALHDTGRRIEAWVLALVIAFGVLWSDALGYHGVSIAPRHRLAELARIDQRFRGQGPTFYTLADEYAAYFLRDLAPTDPALGAPPARSVAATPQGRAPWDPDVLALATIEQFKLIVIGNPALASRPPANYRLVDRGRFYDVWQRAAAPTVLAHFPLGGALFPGAVPSCQQVASIAAEARQDHAMIAYNLRPDLPALAPAQVAHPADWGAVAGDPYSLIPRSEPGVVSGSVTIARPGRYALEVSGSLSQRFTFAVDGHTVGAVSDETGPPGQLIPVASVTLTAGRHGLSVTRPPANLSPADAPVNQLLGPVILVPEGSSGAGVGTLAEVTPAHADQLCGKPLDWIEIVRR